VVTRHGGGPDVGGVGAAGGEQRVVAARSTAALYFSLRHLLPGNLRVDQVLPLEQQTHASCGEASSVNSTTSDGMRGAGVNIRSPADPNPSRFDIGTIMSELSGSRGES
jgi:hypothetical protein